MQHSASPLTSLHFFSFHFISFHFIFCPPVASSALAVSSVLWFPFVRLHPCFPLQTLWWQQWEFPSTHLCWLSCVLCASLPPQTKANYRRKRQFVDNFAATITKEKCHCSCLSLNCAVCVACVFTLTQLWVPERRRRCKWCASHKPRDKTQVILPTRESRFLVSIDSFTESALLPLAREWFIS